MRDEDGDNSDWIELFNSGTSLASLQGWLLVAGTDRWAFPSLLLAPNGRLRVFASGKNRTNDTARLHTSFRLSSAGERLALLNAQGVVQDEYSPAYPPQRADVSYGHAEGPRTGADTLWFPPQARRMEPRAMVLHPRSCSRFPAALTPAPWN